MLKALVFKEWLKIRWAGLIMLAIFMLLTIKMTLTISYAIRIMGANNYWYEIITKGFLFFNDFLYIPVLTGIVIAAFQFFPEITENRLKLTLHLPMKENAILMYMTFLGAVTVLLITGFAVIVVSVITIIYFPVEVYYGVLLTITPWLFSGLVGYFATCTVFVEPIWLKRIFFIIISLEFIDALLGPNHFNYFQNTLPLFLIISLFFSITILFSGHRFRKGVLK